MQPLELLTLGLAIFFQGIAMDPMEWLTLGLAFFAGVQVLIMFKGEARQKAERAADEAAARRRRDEAVDIAYYTCYAEHFRLWALAKRFAASDLAQLALFGLLRPEDLLPRDWGLLTEMLGRLGPEAGSLGAMAASRTHDLAASVGVFVATVVELANRSGSDDLAGRLQYVKDHTSEPLGEMENRLRTGAFDVAELLMDAIRHRPDMDKVRQFHFRNDLRSELGRRIAREIEEHSASITSGKKGVAG